MTAATATRPATCLEVALDLGAIPDDVRAAAFWVDCQVLGGTDHPALQLGDHDLVQTGTRVWGRPTYLLTPAGVAAVRAALADRLHDETTH